MAYGSDTRCKTDTYFDLTTSFAWAVGGALGDTWYVVMEKALSIIRELMVVFWPESFHDSLLLFVARG